jgi:hypothetical protein
MRPACISGERFGHPPPELTHIGSEHFDFRFGKAPRARHSAS